MSNIGRKIILPLTALTIALGFEGSRPFWATDKEDTTRVLQDAGLTPKEVGGFAWFQCGKDDTYATKFTAVSKDNRTVEGAVCKGLFFKGSTIRFK